jgi:hypothetical protein
MITERNAGCGGITVRLDARIHERITRVAEILGTEFDRLFEALFARAYQGIEQTHPSYFDGLHSGSLGTAWMAIVNINEDGKLPEEWSRWITLRKCTFKEYFDFVTFYTHKHQWLWQRSGEEQRHTPVSDSYFYENVQEFVDISIELSDYYELLAHSMMMRDGDDRKDEKCVEKLLHTIMTRMFMLVERTPDEFLEGDMTVEGNVLVEAYNAEKVGKDGVFKDKPVSSATETGVTFAEYFRALFYLRDEDLYGERVHGPLWNRVYDVSPGVFEVDLALGDLGMQPGLRRHIGKWCPHLRISEKDLEELLD